MTRSIRDENSRMIDPVLTLGCIIADLNVFAETQAETVRHVPLACDAPTRTA